MSDPYTPDGNIKSSANIADMQEEVAEWVKAKGWDDDRSFGDEMALLVSETSEALEAFREHGFAEWVVYQPEVSGVKMPKMTPNQLLALDIPEHQWGPPRREGVAPEFAGIFVRLLDDCARHGIDLGAEFRKEMEYNWTRTYRHGGRAL